MPNDYTALAERAVLFEEALKNTNNKDMIYFIHNLEITANLNVKS